MSTLPQTIKRYGEKYAIQSPSLLLQSEERFELIVVVPALSEFENVKRLLASLEAADKNFAEKILILFVVNNRKSSSDEVKNDNKKTMEFLHEVLQKKTADNFFFGYIDAASEGNELDEKNGGVGLARKTGMDAALNLFDYSEGKQQLLVCLDADCTVSENYFSAILASSKRRRWKAAVVNFRHPLEDFRYRDAILCYEIFLRYYVAGLHYAHSPYAFHTIGSTMLCDAESYCKVEGMNKLKAAEDFYFLEKLAKNVKIEHINGAVVNPSPRGSHRVPFGTGQRVNRFLAKTQNEYLLYHFESFTVLKKWLRLFLENTLSAEEYLIGAEEIHPALAHFLLEQKFEKSWSAIMRASKSEQQIQRQKNNWFDGFKTLKLIHYLRDNGFPLQPMFASLNLRIHAADMQLDFTGEEEIPPFAVRQKYLEMLYDLERI